jgi:heme/copper-type cytochrome/quinol oxidase subunit 3
MTRAALPNARSLPVAVPAAQAQAADLPSNLAGPRSTGWWGAVLLIANEAALFGSLLTGYFYLRFSAPAWPLGGLEPPSLTLPIVNTVLLVSSSLAFAWGEHGLTHGHTGRLKLGLALAFVLGAAFLAIQLLEYSRETFTPQTNAYASLFFTITGLHGLHVLAGLIMLAVIQVRTWMGHFTRQRYLGVQVAGMYWHFVDMVWLFVFAIVYISPHL